MPEGFFLKKRYIFMDSLLAGEAIADLEHGSPLGEAASQGVVLGSHLGQAVQTYTHSG